MNRPRAADDFATIRTRIDELRRERSAVGREAQDRSGRRSAGRGDNEAERRRRERIEGSPPPWVPTIFITAPQR